jgi:hypothetical protein
MMEAEHYYKYSQLKLQDGIPQEGEPTKYRVVFGWTETVQEEIDFSKPLVYSYHSRSKFATDDEKVWSKSAGTNLSTLEDYRKFFNSLAGESPESFLNRWSLSEDELKAHWDNKYPNTEKKDQHIFMTKLARLIVEGKKFVMYSRGYKLIEPEETEVEDEGGDET